MVEIAWPFSGTIILQAVMQKLTWYGWVCVQNVGNNVGACVSRKGSEHQGFGFLRTLKNWSYPFPWWRGWWWWWRCEGSSCTSRENPSTVEVVNCKRSVREKEVFFQTDPLQFTTTEGKTHPTDTAKSKSLILISYHKTPSLGLLLEANSCCRKLNFETQEKHQDSNVHVFEFPEIPCNF